MDKEIMDKVNEMMKSSGRREMTMDELEQVVGGIALPGPEPNTVIVDGVVVDCVDFNNAYQELVSQYGFDVAFDAFCRMTFFSKNEEPKSGSDHERMDMVLNSFWKVVGRIQQSGHSY